MLGWLTFQVRDCWNNCGGALIPCGETPAAATLPSKHDGLCGGRCQKIW